MLSTEGYFTESNYWQKVGCISSFTGNHNLHSWSSISNPDSSCSHLIYSIILQRDQDNNFQGQDTELLKGEEEVQFIGKWLFTSACSTGRSVLQSHELKTPWNDILPTYFSRTLIMCNSMVCRHQTQNILLSGKLEVQNTWTVEIHQNAVLPSVISINESQLCSPLNLTIASW